MGEARFTTGEWVVGVSVDQGWPVFRLRALNSTNPDGAEVQANAALIEAAPKLFYACEAVAEWLGQVERGSPMAKNAAALIREKTAAALQKAKGA